MMNYVILLPFFKFIAVFLCSFTITYFSIPIVVKVSKAKNIFDLPNGRASHSNATPTLGGVAMFAGLVVTCLIFITTRDIPTFQFLMAGGFILFFFGMEDDLIALSWRMKIFGELLAAFFLVVLGDFRITDLHGILGIHHLDYLTSILVTIVAALGIINAINLIDGVDGLAAGLSFIAAVIFGSWFFLTGQNALAVIAYAVMGILIAYVVFNVFGTKNKIFMGDTGALLLGYLMTIFVIDMNQNIVPVSSKWYINNAPVVSFAVLFIPLFDTLRVMTVRIIKRQSPFKADRNHIHHRIIRLGFTHRQTSLIIMLLNGFLLTVVFLMQNLEIHLLILITFCLGITKSLVLVYLGKPVDSTPPKAMVSYRDASKEVAKSLQHDEVRMKN